jgi:hypothetical protein
MNINIEQEIKRLKKVHDLDKFSFNKYESTIRSLSIPKPIGPFGADVQIYTNEEVTTAIFQSICEWVIISNKYHIWEREVRVLI